MSNENTHYDVVIVGAGIAGSIVANELGKAGKRVLVIEAGPDKARKEYLSNFASSSFKLPESPYPPLQTPDPAITPHPDINPAHEAVPRATVFDTLPFNIDPNYPVNTVNIKPNTVTTDPPIEGNIYDPDKSYLLQKGPLAFASTYERITGGTTWHWLGTSLRFLKNDFKMRSTYGVAQGGGTSPLPPEVQDWPLNVHDLTGDRSVVNTDDDYYAKAENEIGVAASVTEQQGQLDSQGLVYSSGYSYPLQPVPPSVLDQKVATAVNDKHFTEPDPTHQQPSSPPIQSTIRVTGTPAGRNTQPYGIRPACAGNTNCIPICPIQAKYDATTTLNKARRYNNVEIISQSVVTKLLIENDRVSGVQYVQWTKDGPGVHKQPARTVHGTIVVLAAHAIEIPRLLLMSADDSQPNGVANSSGLVGCNLMDHPLYLSWALAADSASQHPNPNAVYGYRGPLSTSGIETLRDGDFRRYRASWRVEIGNEGWNFSAGDPWATTLDMIDGNNASQLNPGQEKLFGDALVHSLNDNFTRQWRMAFLVEQTPDRNNRVTLSSTKNDGLGLPRPEIRYDLSDYTKLGFVYAELFARRTYKLTNSTCYTLNPAQVERGGPSDKVPNPTWFAMKDEWKQIFRDAYAEDPDLKNPKYTNIHDSHNPDAIPEGFQYFGAGHIVGTCTMGSSRTNSVVNSDLRSWDHENLYILGSAVFPTVTTANPTLTIAALAFRAAAKIKSLV